MLMFFHRDIFECISTYVNGLVKNLLLHITYIRYSLNFIVCLKKKLCPFCINISNIYYTIYNIIQYTYHI